MSGQGATVLDAAIKRCRGACAKRLTNETPVRLALAFNANAATTVRQLAEQRNEFGFVARRFGREEIPVLSFVNGLAFQEAAI